MSEWWDGLSTLLKILYCVAAPSTLILLIQTIMSMFGFHDGGAGTDFSDTSGIDFDAGGGADIPNGGDLSGFHDITSHDITGHHQIVDGGNLPTSHLCVCSRFRLSWLFLPFSVGPR